jgi:thiamine biosynthesis lipoprotein
MSAVGKASRRGCLRVVSAMAGTAVLPAAAASRGALRWRWVGAALGARASITLHHPDRGEARRIVRACLAEIRRLEGVFSLYRADSALSRLNRDGSLDVPPPEMVQMLSSAKALRERTGGAFDVSVQPLWSLYRNHFSRQERTAGGPSDRELDAARRAVDLDAVTVDTARIGLGRRGMALTFNGIAQGFITDRVADLLRRAGLDSVLLDLGEIRALGLPSRGRAWQVELPASRDRGEPPLRLGKSAAVATSAPAAFVFDASGRHHHLFDPATGRSAGRHAAVTVVAPTATRADALSTAFALMDRAEIQNVVNSYGDVRVRLLGVDGSLHWIGS